MSDSGGDLDEDSLRRLSLDADRHMASLRRIMFRGEHYHKKRDGIFRVGFPGESDRFLTWWETILYYFGRSP